MHHSDDTVQDLAGLRVRSRAELRNKACHAAGPVGSAAVDRAHDCDVNHAWLGATEHTWTLDPSRMSTRDVEQRDVP